MENKITILLLFAIVLIKSAFAQIPMEGLIAYYPFNGNASDESGNGNDGLVIGADLFTDRFGDPGKAYFFDGNNDEITITTSTLLQGVTASDHSFSVWVRMESIPMIPKFVIDASAAPDQRGIRFHLSEYPVFKWVTTENSFIVASPISVGIVQWHHIVGTLEGDTGKIYIDGALVRTVIGSGLPTSIEHNEDW